MKKTLITLISALAFVFVGNAQQTVKQTKDLDPFTKVKVTDDFKVTLRNKPAYSVAITSDERIAEYVRCIVKNGVLSFALDEKNFPAELKKALKEKNASEPVLNIEVFMPRLNELEVENKAVIVDSDILNANDFVLKVSGQAVVTKLFLDCSTAELEFTNNSRSNVSASIKTKLSVNASNNAVATISHKNGNGVYETKGSSVLNISSDALELQFIASGSSECYVSGRASMLAVETSGSSHIDAEALEAQQGTFDMSNSSECNINVEEHIKVNLEDGCILTYKRTPKMEVERIIKSTLIKADDPSRKK